jgi:hypothetical protein
MKETYMGFSVSLCQQSMILILINCIISFYCRIISENNGIPPLTFKRFQAVLSRMSLPAKPEERISLETIGEAKTPITLDHDEQYGVPSLEELGK